ncbi:MAG: hypothetical protein ACTSP9_08605 [Promethearchaeota archaeon]
MFKNYCQSNIKLLIKIVLIINSYCNKNRSYFGVKRIYYRGYVLIRLKIIGTQWDIINKLKEFNKKESSEDWKITYSAPVYGGWDLMVECIFSNLSDLEKIINYCRTDEDLQKWLDATTTLISVKNNYVP